MQASHLCDLSPGILPLLSLLSGTDMEQRVQEKEKTAHRHPTVKYSLTQNCFLIVGISIHNSPKCK